MRHLAVSFLLVLVGCSGAGASPATTGEPGPTMPSITTTITVSTTTTTTTNTSTTHPSTTTTVDPYARPDWLGQRPLPLRPDGLGEVQPTPEELRDRQLDTIDVLAPPIGDAYLSTIEEIPDDVLSRSTWNDQCPVGVDELRYLTMSFYGFDQELHTGEMIVDAAVASDVVEVFRKLFEARFPIEEMRVSSVEDLEQPPTGDGNNTTAFVCRPAVGSTNWSYHAYGRAIDVNPFHNPYVKGDLVIPELASAYVDRDDVRRGMILPGDVVTGAFTDISWEWGGAWDTLKDWMHFQKPGR